MDWIRNEIADWKKIQLTTMGRAVAAVVTMTFLVICLLVVIVAMSLLA